MPQARNTDQIRSDAILKGDVLENPSPQNSEIQEAVRDIKEDEFFYVVHDNYDEHIELAIPFYRLMHDEMIRFVPRTDGELKILDLGCGTGRTARALLEAFPKAKLRGIDLFNEMLNHARVRLAPYAERVEYVRGDFRSIELGYDYDICISALAIHHSTAKEKQNLFQRIFKAVKPTGRFVMIDWTKFDSTFVQNLSAKLAELNVARSGASEQIVDEWRRHWREKNIPDTVEDMQEWLLRAGFSHAECVLRCYGIAMITSEK